MSLSDDTTSRWRQAAATGDADLAADCLAEDVQVISPLTDAFRFRGRQQARDMLVAAFRVITTLEFHTEVGDEQTRALFFHGRCGREVFEEAQLLRFDEAGLIVELTLFGRPLPGLTAVMAAIGPELLKDQQRPGMGRLIGVATAPLALFSRLGDKRLVPLAAPGRTVGPRP